MFDGAYLIRFSCPLLLTLEQAYCIVVTVANNKHCRCCVVPRGACSFSFFFFYVSQHIHRVSALLGQLCSLCFSRSRSCVIHLRERGGTSSSFHAYMHCECTCVRCTSGNEHVMNEKNVLFHFFLFDLNFFLRYPTAICQAFDG